MGEIIENVFIDNKLNVYRLTKFVLDTLKKNR